jgi:autotransporter-associated beta strand protein
VKTFFDYSGNFVDRFFPSWSNHNSSICHHMKRKYHVSRSRKIAFAVVSLTACAFWALPVAQAHSWTNETTPLEARGGEMTFSSGSRLFYAGPSWLLNAMPGSNRARGRYVLDQAGDLVESKTHYNGYVGTLRDEFAGGMVGNGSLLLRPPSKTFLPTIVTAGTAYYFSGVLDSLWSADATWGPTASGFPNAQGDAALNLLSVSSNVFQDVVGGVTVGSIDHHPTSALNAGPGVNWLITTNNPITLDQDGAGPDTARIGNTQTVKINSLTIDGPGGLILADNLEITNLNALGGVVNIATNLSGSAGNNVTVIGPGSVLFTHSTTYQGATTINSGTLNAATFNALGGTSGITVNAGGTLLLSGTTANRINDSAEITLNGGRFNSAGLTEGGASAPGMGALTLLSSSIIDLGNAASLLAFANSSAETWAGTLSIHNWTGTIGNGNGTDQLYFGSDSTGLTGTQLSQILFFSDGGTTLLGSGQILGDGEVVPVPEPTTWAAGALAFGAIAFLQRRRFRGLLARRA